MNIPNGRIRSGWNIEAMLVRGQLTDRKIEQYRKRGFYSSEYRMARKKLMDSRSMKNHMNRVGNGNFFESEDGRLIYSPV